LAQQVPVFAVLGRAQAGAVGDRLGLAVAATGAAALVPHLVVLVQRVGGGQQGVDLLGFGDDPELGGAVALGLPAFDLAAPGFGGGLHVVLGVGGDDPRLGLDRTGPLLRVGVGFAPAGAQAAEFAGLPLEGVDTGAHVRLPFG